MSSTINAATSGGLISTGDTSGQLQLQTAGTTALSISSGQVVTLTNALPIASGGTGSTTLAGANIATTNSSTQSINSANTFGFKNRIINGGMTISQRGTSFNPATNGLGLDRWTIRSSPSASAFSITQSTSAPTGFLNSQLITSLGATTVGSGDYYTIDQRIETANAYDFAWGTASPKTVTLSFWVYSSLTGTFAGGLTEYNSGSVSYGFNYSIPTANTWTQISVTISGPTTGTWNTTLNGGYVTVTFGLGVGSSVATPSNNSWVSGNYKTGNGGVNVVSTSGATFYITGVQLEVGTQATSFDFRDYGRELILCYRYFYKSNPENASRSGNAWGSMYATTSACLQGLFPVTMRAVPSVTRGGSSDTFYISAVNATSSGTSNNFGIATTTYSFEVSSLSGSAIGYPVEYNGQLSWSAEL